MTGQSGNFFCRLILFVLLLASFSLVAVRPAAAQRRGGGGGGGGGDSGGTSTAWIEEFRDGNFINNGWGIEQTGSLDSQFGVPGTGLVGKSFDASNVFVDSSTGILRLQLSITGTSSSGFRSTGALVYKKQTYGYGVYEWCARMSADTNGSPLPGSVSAGFVYINNSQTEVDFEQAHGKEVAGPNEPLYLWLYMANWFNRRLTSSRVKSALLPGIPTPLPTYAEFKNYKFDWRSDSIDFRVNGERAAFHTSNIPKAAAYVMMNHWGTHNPDGFGGPAQAGTAYYYIDWVRYTPPGGSAIPPQQNSCPGS